MNLAGDDAGCWTAVLCPRPLRILNADSCWPDVCVTGALTPADVAMLTSDPTAEGLVTGFNIVLGVFDTDVCPALAGGLCRCWLGVTLVVSVDGSADWSVLELRGVLAGILMTCCTVVPWCCLNTITVFIS